MTTTLGGPHRRAAGRGRLRVKEEVRRWQQENEEAVRANEAGGRSEQPLPCPFVTRADFDRLVRDRCAGSPDAGDTTPVLEWLHRTGVVFWRERLFGDRVLVDQRWAIKGIYTLFERERTAHRLTMAAGIFRPHHLARWAWDAAGYTAAEQALFLEFMRSCGLCFELLSGREAADGKPAYVAPEYLREDGDAALDQERGDWRRGFDGRPEVQVSATHPFLGKGVAKALVNRAGTRWGRSALRGAGAWPSPPTGHRGDPSRK